MNARYRLPLIVLLDASQVACGTPGPSSDDEPLAEHQLAAVAGRPRASIKHFTMERAKFHLIPTSAAALLQIAALNIGKTHAALPACYRRLGARVGKAKAVIATARKLAVLFYNGLRFGMTYADPGADYYQQWYQDRVSVNERHYG